MVRAASLDYTTRNNLNLLPPCPDSVNMDAMTIADIHAKFQHSYRQAINGETVSAMEAFYAFRKGYVNEMLF